MRIQTEYISFENRWTTSSSYDFQVHQHCSQKDVVFPRLLSCDSRCSKTGGQRSKACHQHSEGCRWCSEGCSQHSEGCSRRSEGCSRHSEGCSLRSEGCSRRSEGCSRRSEACSRRSEAGCWRNEECCRRSKACRRHSQALPGAPNVPSGAPRCSPTYHHHSHGTPVPVVRIPVTPKAGRNGLLGSDTLLKLMHLSLHSTSSQTLLEAPSD